MKPVHALIRRSNPGIEIDLLSDKPKVLCNFSGGIQAIRMDKPGLEPDITSFNIEENNEGFGGTFTKKKRTSDKRKKIFNNPKTASEYTFDTTSVYTFDHYDDVMELSTFKLRLSSMFTYDLDKVVGDPFYFLARTRSGEYLWYFELWHERLVEELSQ